MDGKEAEMLVEVVEEAAPDPDAVLTLKALVERVSGAAVAAALPTALYKSWLTFASASAPLLQFLVSSQGQRRHNTGGGIFLFL